jgi:hypothetical protein
MQDAASELRRIPLPRTRMNRGVPNSSVIHWDVFDAYLWSLPAQCRLFHNADKLRCLMCNELSEKVRQLAQRSAEQFVRPLAAGVSGDLRRKAAQQAF